MKTIIYSVLFCFVCFSCRKELPPSNPADAASAPILPAYWAAVNGFLKHHLPDSLFKKLDSTNCKRTFEPPYWYFRIGFTDQSDGKRFILLITDSIGTVSSSSLIDLSSIKVGNGQVSGRIRVKSLTGQPILDSKISNGYVDVWTQGVPDVTRAESKALSSGPAYKVLPAVIVTPGSGASDVDLYIALSYFGPGSSSGNSGASGGNGAGTMTYSRAATSLARSTANRPQTITVETSNLKPAISLKDFQRCFDGVSDAGASYSINVLVDLPVNDDPTQFFDPASGAIGHVFLELTKANGSQSVNQIIGFTATEPFAAFTSGSVPSKLVDNGGHKYNGRLTVPVSATEFQKAVANMQTQAENGYDLQHYNCTDYALCVINSARGNYPLVINEYAMPGGTTEMSTPEALYNLLQTMARPGAPEAGNISTGGVYYAGVSHGPCN